MLNGDNFFRLEISSFLTLGCMDLDLAFRVDEPPIPTDSRTPTEKASYELLERSNPLSLAHKKAYKQRIRVQSQNALKSVREHIMHMRDIAAQLKLLEVDISEPFLVHLILNSLRKEKTRHKKKDCRKYKKWLEKKARNAKFLEDLETSGSNIPRKEVFEEDQVSSKTFGELTFYPDENAEIRRSSRVKKYAISSVYLQESDFDIGLEKDPTSFSQAMSSENSNLWHNVVKEEIASMDKNQVWELTKLPEGAKPVCTIPDIAFAIGMLGRYQSNLGIEHWEAAKKVMRDLQGTKDFQLIYKHTKNLEVVGYSDSDFAGCLDTHKSTSRYIFLLANRAMSWKSTKQTITASSTMEAEFVACYEVTSQALWLRHFITGLKIVDSIFRPIQIFCDNSAAIFFSKNNKSGSRNKHIDIKYFVVREKVNKKEIVIQHIRTELMVADPITKALSSNSYKNHVDRMSLVNPM
ncbi:UNVERIFIED_CONTAM: Secreted RxLR effector protein [Sesamum calycinum]|uniref:Secreted RxLR effector protein n=1 Tax=Sesamum calycinum TaxID=2727403 RepID=A0AAW2QZC7_9LAMI